MEHGNDGSPCFEASWFYKAKTMAFREDTKKRSEKKKTRLVLVVLIVSMSKLLVTLQRCLKQQQHQQDSQRYSQCIIHQLPGDVR
jgi:hypothetical protein